MRWEVEQKYQIDHMAETKQHLADLGAHFAAPIEQTDQYFAHPARDFGQTDEALRLRRVGQDDNFVTYKGPKVDSTTKTRSELELPLPSGPLVQRQFTTLLEALGFRPVAMVHKRREPGTLRWEGQQIEVALDEVLDLGTFIELEIGADDSDLAAAKQALASLAKILGLAKSERRSYLELLLDALS